MHVHEFFDLSITVGTGVTLYLIMQFLGYAVVRYLNRGWGMAADRNQGWRDFEAGSPFRRQLPTGKLDQTRLMW